MNRGRVYSFVGVLVIAFIALFFQGSNDDDLFSEAVKISLRDVGNKLLLSNQDSTSLILPVVELEEMKFQLSFQHSLSFEPSKLVAIIKNSLEKSGLPQSYIVEVIRCLDKEVAYSYRMTTDEQTTIIPCAGRVLPLNCYSIEVNFIANSNGLLGGNVLLYFLILLCLVLVAWSSFKKKTSTEEKRVKGGFKTIGSFQFYPEQNKLVKSATEIGLSRKECELLTIFVANANQVVKRDELTKRVWEDNGVIVGRSLDTYISKLRIKLKGDESIKLINIHGVGYKLETNN